MIRKIVKIDENKCNGCGICAKACHEGAIDIIDGKAKLVRESFCDGFGDCLPGCPMNAISFEEREAPEYDEEAVKKAKENCDNPNTHSCPGSQMRVMKHPPLAPFHPDMPPMVPSELHQWPCQIKLVPVKASFFDGAKLLIAADCTAYAYANMHHEFMRDRVTIIGCPKLDGVDYTQKLCDIITNNDIKSVLIVRMEVPCCGGIENAAKNALRASGKFIPWDVKTISIDGKVLD